MGSRPWRGSPSEASFPSRSSGARLASSDEAALSFAGIASPEPLADFVSPEADSVLPTVEHGQNPNKFQFPKFKIFKIIIALLVVVAIVIGGYFALANYFPQYAKYVQPYLGPVFDPVINTFLDVLPFQVPERVIQRSIESMTNVKSFEYDIKVDSELKMGNLPLGQAKTSLSGVTDINDTSDPKGMMKFKIEDPRVGTLLDIESLNSGGTIYFKINDVFSGGFYGFDITSFIGKWIKADYNSVKGQFEASAVEAGREQSKNKLSSQQIEDIKQAIKDIKFLDITEKLSGEEINGVSTYHYQFSVIKEGLSQLIIKINEIVGSKSLTKEEIENWNKMLEGLSVGGEIWIGKKDLLPYKYSIVVNLTQNGEQQFQGKLSILAEFKNFNQPINIETPSSAIELEEILSDIFKAPDIVRDSILKDSDNDGLSDDVEAIYGTDPNNPDTDGDSWPDGEEVQNGYNPLGQGRVIK